MKCRYMQTANPPMSSISRPFACCGLLLGGAAGSARLQQPPHSHSCTGRSEPALIVDMHALKMGHSTLDTTTTTTYCCSTGGNSSVPPHAEAACSTHHNRQPSSAVHTKYATDSPSPRLSTPAAAAEAGRASRMLMLAPPAAAPAAPTLGRRKGPRAAAPPASVLRRDTLSLPATAPVRVPTGWGAAAGGSGRPPPVAAAASVAGWGWRRSRRQMGQEELRESQASMQGWWKAWEQGRRRRASPAEYSPRHTAQAG
jgi:hypothetical protein